MTVRTVSSSRISAWGTGCVVDDAVHEPNAYRPTDVTVRGAPRVPRGFLSPFALWIAGRRPPGAASEPMTASAGPEFSRRRSASPATQTPEGENHEHAQCETLQQVGATAEDQRAEVESTACRYRVRRRRRGALRPGRGR
jgi:hypothetical protein